MTEDTTPNQERERKKEVKRRKRKIPPRPRLTYGATAHRAKTTEMGLVMESTRRVQCTT